MLAAQGLHPLPADRHVRHRGQRRLGHVACSTSPIAAGAASCLAKLDLDPALLPPCYESSEVSAQGERAGCAATGLAVGTPVVGGGGDQPAGAVGNGIVRPGVVSATMGTSGVVFAHADALGLRPARPAPARLPRRAGRLARDGGRALGRRELSMVSQRAGQGRGRGGQGPGGSTPISCSPTRRRWPASERRGCSSCRT